MKPAQIRKILGRALEIVDGDTPVLMLLVVNECAAARGLPPSWETGVSPAAVKRVAEVLAAFGSLADWGAYELGNAYEYMMATEKRARQGSWYTPPEVAEFMVRFTIGPQIDRLAKHPDPGNVLQVLATDPACGAGVFLVAAARYVAYRYVSRITGLADPAALLIHQALPEVMSSCVFGVDIDPIAVDLAKSSLWLETRGTTPIHFMDRNIIRGNVLEGDLPPRLAEIYPNPVGAAS